MTTSTALTLYRPSDPIPSSTLTTTPRANSLISSRLFSQQTGTAIATELLYRILIELLNRLFCTLQRFASERLDKLSSFLEQRAQERREARVVAAEAAKMEKGAIGGGGGGGLGIVEEINKLSSSRGEGFGFGPGVACPITTSGSAGTNGKELPKWMKKRGINEPPKPPRWVKSVFEGIGEGRLEVSDFWMNTHMG
ncbi:uncharacterized protein BDR25DRAFT_300493 [Lindgomyces ingoldianus]|uniref:Uncharacterized protein n=1 Tax=Lindgomyces ingoldianus TaxID=673940 RepID=A0ACB6RB73_9PLEO|nr:uncharacterized protein BDR25DRAFT_300493 [Lindgomyces ingoldianus]KAF2476533.1 hypothetical protein BDR25DRAFT_300493 [Lindgomyces ingoldianus]